jgi:hypothetical protein
MNTSIRPAGMRIFAAAAILLSSLALAALGPARGAAAAAPYPPTNTCTVSTSDTTVQAGQTINITGSGFTALSTVDLTVDSTSLGSVRTDVHGSFIDTVTIPSTVRPGAHSVVADSGSLTCSFSLTAPHGVSPISVHRSHEPPLASTGFATLTASVVAVVLLVGGGLLVVLGRRRRSL